MRIKPKYLIAFFLVLVSIGSSNQWSKFPIGNTFFWWIIYLSIIVSFIIWKKHLFNNNNNSSILTIKIYLIWIVICIFRGIIIAENYWEWKNLISTGMVLLLPLSIFVFTDTVFVQTVFKSWLQYSLPFFIILVPFLFADAIGQYLAPISYILLFFPSLSKKWKLIIISVFVFVIISDLGARSNVIKFIVPLLLSCIYYLPFLRFKKVLEVGRLILLALPVILFGLGVNSIFNPFQMDKYIEGDYKTAAYDKNKDWEGNLKADTRTFLYKEVIGSAIKHNYIVFGRTPARGNESASFGYHAAVELKLGRMERFRNEVSVLNIFTWTGLVGLILYFMVFYQASYLAINRSNNIFMKILGLYIAFRWVFGWVEDFTNFNLFNVFLWVMISMCFSIDFRKMNNKEMVAWVKGIFDKRDRFTNTKVMEQSNI